MRTVLVCATYFSDEVFLGSLRINALAKHLPEHGWQPVILTPRIPTAPAIPRDQIEIVEYADMRATYARLKRRLGGDRHTEVSEVGTAAGRPSTLRTATNSIVELGKRMIVPDPSIAWWPPGVRAARKRIAVKGRVDAILTSSNPVGPHFIGHSLHRKEGIPWIADFRDLWSLNHYYAYGPMRRRLEGMIERRLMSDADALVTLSDAYVKRLREFYRDDSRPYHAIPLGFDPEIVVTSPPRLDDAFTITFTGNFVKGKRDPALLFEGVRRAIARGDVDASRLSIQFWGPRYAWIDERASQAGLDRLVHQNGYVSREEALRQQRTAQVIALFLWDHPAEAGAYSGKMEFLVAGRPIMVLTPPRGGIWEQLAVSTGTGTPLHDADAVAAYLREAFRQYREEGAVRYAGDQRVIQSFSYPEIARQFARVLDASVQRWK
jgi:glycosyltransferase involved in cell wall biosynthesis